MPFSWTTALSGVAVDTGNAGATACYLRAIERPDDFGAARVVLVVGAADWHATVALNGVELTTNDNGYLPFRVDLTDALGAGPNVLTIRVADVGNHAEYPHGKQGLPWYTNMGGLWQTVYLEAVPAASIAALKLVAKADLSGFALSGRVAGDAAGCALRVYGETTGPAPLVETTVQAGTFATEVPTPDLPAWTPQTPALLPLEVRLDCGAARGGDAVRSYAGLRTVGRAQVPGKSFEMVHLNGAPVFIRGVLVQGYFPDGGYTAPTLEALRADLLAAKEAGYNLVRLHIKVEEPLVLFLADSLGLLVDADVPSYGAFPFQTGDTAAARARWQATLDGMAERDFNHPAIVWWTLFNEGWGLTSLLNEYAQNAEQQAFVSAMLAHARTLDETRLIEDHSTLRFDHVAGSDVNSFHLYPETTPDFAATVADIAANTYPGSPFNMVPGHVQGTAPLLNTEYGPFSYENGVPAWKRDRDISWGLRRYTGVLRQHENLVGYVFTELYDVEFEKNGLLTYKRLPKEFGYDLAELTVAELNAADFVGFREPHFQVEAGAPLTLTPFVSRFGAPARAAETLTLVLLDETGVPRAQTSVPVVAPAYAVTTLAPVTFELPPELAGAAVVTARWADDDAAPRVVARNFLPGEIVAAVAETAPCTATACRIPLDLGACTGDVDPDSGATVAGTTQATGFLGAGSLRCPVALPPEVPTGRVLTATLGLEIAANVRGAPQTRAGNAATAAVTVTIGDAPAFELPIPPDRADSRGILSCLNGPVPQGGFGDWVETAAVTLPARPVGDTLTVTFAAAGDAAGGLSLYGARMGRYGRVPALDLRSAP